MSSDGILETLKGKTDVEVAQLMQVNSLGFWCEKSPIMLDGKIFSFSGHEYMREPYFDTSDSIVVMKAAQMGWSTWAILKTLHSLRFKYYPQGVLYLFPSREAVTEFSKSRFQRFLDENPGIRTSLKDTDSANIKKIGSSFLYLRGTRSRETLKSIPVDMVVYDEYDEMDAVQVDLAMHRLDHSDYKHWVKISTPFMPEGPIDKAFQVSDQKKYVLQCGDCKKITCLEDEFPKCIEKRAGQYERVCRWCGKILSLESGHYKAYNPGSPISGYHVSQLVSSKVSLEELMEEFEHTNNLTEYYNSRLGMPYVDALNKLTVNDVYACCGHHTLKLRDSGPCTMGVDQGKDLHVVITKRTGYNTVEVLYLGVHDKWEDLDRFMWDFGIISCVIDGLPDTESAKIFSRKHQGRVYQRMAYSPISMGRVAWDYDNFTVKANRVEVLDNSHNQILSRKITLPRRCKEVDDFAAHCTGIAKKILVDTETGQQKPVWIKTNPDHYRHAFNFECMARSRVAYLPEVTEAMADKDYRPMDAVAGY